MNTMGEAKWLAAAEAFGFVPSHRSGLGEDVPEVGA